MNTCRKS